jgi:hypothetical protein
MLLGGMQFRSVDHNEKIGGSTIAAMNMTMKMITKITGSPQ